MSLLILGLTLLISFGAMAYLKSVYAEASQVPVVSGLTGAETAERILQWAGIHDVEVAEGESFLGDHYDPMEKTLVLSPENYHGTSAAHVGVAAHECGHAMQHQHNYAPLNIRMGAVYATNFASTGVTVVAFASLFFHILSPFIALWLIALCFAVLIFFNLITLPVEFDASARAKTVLQQLGIVRAGPEAKAVSDTLFAAGLTYVAALVGTILNFAYYFMLLSGRSRN
ncbi:MAG TPA: zinc metallopeptidase [Candidatus Methylacidiphilales bacterium]|nr:zinc metallopeptidase [Candidatus Methylacidiphilales bacterium]